MTVNKKSYFTRKGGSSAPAGGSQPFIEAWMRITLMELPISPTEERIIAAFVESSMKKGKMDESIFYAA
jgi:hypothetical protein